MTILEGQVIGFQYFGLYMLKIRCCLLKADNYTPGYRQGVSLGAEGFPRPAFVEIANRCGPQFFSHQHGKLPALTGQKKRVMPVRRIRRPFLKTCWISCFFPRRI